MVKTPDDIIRGAANEALKRSEWGFLPPEQARYLYACLEGLEARKIGFSAQGPRKMGTHWHGIDLTFQRPSQPSQPASEKYGLIYFTDKGVTYTAAPCPSRQLFRTVRNALHHEAHLLSRQDDNWIEPMMGDISLQAIEFYGHGAFMPTDLSTPKMRG
jgi:hypothetical protein